MALRALIAVTVLAALCTTSPSIAGGQYVAPNAPKDTPEEARGTAEIEALRAALKPAMETARRTYPDARDRFLRGLPARHSFFVVTRLPVAPNGVEQVFVGVDRIAGGNISGRIWSDIQRARGYKKGDPYSLPESEVIDWLITRPDGSEEANYVGKAIDKLQADRLQRQPSRRP